MQTSVWYTILDRVRLFQLLLKIECLDGDTIRQNLTLHLDLTKEDRGENIERVLGFNESLIAVIIRFDKRQLPVNKHILSDQELYQSNQN
jgi:hypothetical protein